MKKAVLYARVSSNLQKKEKTIESQIEALKEQIIKDGCILIKEYIDEGFSGAMLDRPAMNQLREDIKTDMFEKVYFLNTDRIAREVTYQIIIVGEMLKNKKQLIINGQDYVHNPENKFTLTILGAVAELERAKIVERIMRSKKLRIAQGSLSGSGAPIYGYDHLRRTQTSPPQYVINKKEAEVVKYIFETYANENVGINHITRTLEERDVPTKFGKKLWRKERIKYMLQNEMYTGVRYYQMLKTEYEYGNPLLGSKGKKLKIAKRPREEWMPVPVPALVSREVFEKVNKRLKENRKRYRNPQIEHLLSSRLYCGSCGSSMFSCRRHYTDRRRGKPLSYEYRSYQCNYKSRSDMHAKKNLKNMKKCDNMQIKDKLIEGHVLRIVEESLINEKELKKHMDYFKKRTQASQLKLEKQIKKNSEKLFKLKDTKKRILDIYTQGDISREEYVERNMKIDDETKELEKNNTDISNKIPLLQKKDIVSNQIAKFCVEARVKFEHSDSFESRRSFVLEYANRIVYCKEDLVFHGSVPIKDSKDNIISNIDFFIKTKIPYKERFSRKRK